MTTPQIKITPEEGKALHAALLFFCLDEQDPTAAMVSAGLASLAHRAQTGDLDLDLELFNTAEGVAEGEER